MEDACELLRPDTLPRQWISRDTVMYNFRRKSAFLSLLLGFLMLAAAFSSSAASAVDEVFDLVSRVEGGPQLVSRPDGPTEEVVISADGRFVAYQSEASNLVE